MADNFRNKQWFKNMSQNRKDEICKKFDINEKTLKKCGRETDDGRIVIDILRIDKLLHTPECWDECYNNLKSININNIHTNNLDEMIVNLQYIYICMHPECSFLKYKSSVHNDLLTKQFYDNFIYWYEYMSETNKSDIDHMKYCCYQIYNCSKYLFESDLKLIKKNK